MNTWLDPVFAALTLFPQIYETICVVVTTSELGLCNLFAISGLVCPSLLGENHRSASLVSRRLNYSKAQFGDTEQFKLKSKNLGKDQRNLIAIDLII